MSDHVIIAGTLLPRDARCLAYCAAAADSNHNRWGLPDGGAKPDRSRNAADTYPVEMGVTFTFENCVCPIFLRASVSIYSGSAQVRNVIYATVGKRVGCGDPCRTLRDPFNPPGDYQAKYPTC